MKMLLVLTLELDEPTDLMHTLDKIDPEKLPFFAGTVRIVVEPTAGVLERWLDE